jgi:spore coat protein U-like protein
MSRRSRYLLLVLLSCAAAPSHALVSCATAASGLVFGVYDPLSATSAVSTGSLTVTCTLLSGAAITVPVRVDLSTGSSGNYGTRTTTSGAQVLNYNLFWSTAYTQVWGDGTGGSFYGTGSVFVSPASPTQSASGTMYGRIPAGQDVGAGVYQDIVVVTVTY